MKPIQNILTAIALAICLFNTVSATAQIIKSCSDNIDLCITGEACTTDFFLPYPDWTTNCPQNVLTYNYSGSFGFHPLPVGGVQISDIGIGEYVINISTVDDCGNSANCLFFLYVRDCHAPTANCTNSLVVDLMGLSPPEDVDNDGDIDQAALQIRPSNFLTTQDSSDCSGLIDYSIHRAEAVVGGTEIPNRSRSSLTLTCDDIGTLALRIYAWDNGFNPYAVQPDGSVGGPNYDWCETTVVVQDALYDACSGNSALMTISGTIHTPWGAALQGALVEINNGFQTHILTTDAEGQYALELPAGQYWVRPYSDNLDYTNGVDSIDLVLIRMHMLGEIPFDSPYKLLAADANWSRSITVFDLMELRNLILGIDNSLPAPSWQFVDESYDFPVPQNPFSEPLPDLIVVNAVNSQANFIGFKTGDVNWDAELLTGVEGTVYLSETGDCTIDVDQETMKRWVVTAREPGENHLYYGLTTNLGAYRLSIPPGDYLVSLRPLNEMWDVCHQEVPVTVGETNYQVLNLSAKSIYDCPVMSVEIGAPFLRRCFSNQFSVYFANTGSVTAEDAYVNIAFDEYLEVTESSIPWNSVSDNTYTFPIGDVSPGQNGYFKVTAFVSCEAMPGQTHCAEARIYPDTICSPQNALWDGSDLKITSQCEADTLRFLIKNEGDNMQQNSLYHVIVDDMIMMSGEVSLLAGGIKEINHLADGATLRLMVSQAPGHPSLGMPSVAVEGCGLNETGTFSTGFVTQFPENEADPNISIYCGENIATYVPNNKQAFPKGVGEAHYIEPGQELEYVIRFQNTGTDTAFALVIHDTLSNLLDPATLQPGVSSHPCNWQLRNDGVLSISFSDILLPDSTTNEPASHGFAAFRIRQREGVELPAIIKNKAAIYFDFNEPVITNEVMHTVDTNFMVVVTFDREVLKEVSMLRFSPNPIKAGASVRIAGKLPDNGVLVIYSNTGRPMATVRLRDGIATLPADLPAGWYLLELRSENQVIGRGKVVIGF